MIDLDVVEMAARKPWYCRSKQEDNLLSPEILVELITRLRQAEKDAARYRWLRHMAEVDGATEMMLAILISDDWDSAIDEAMNGSNN